MSIAKKRCLVFLFSILLLVGMVSGVRAQGNSADSNVIWGADYSRTRFQNIIGLGEQDPRITIAKVIRFLLGFLGIIAVSLILYAGFIWMTSGGNEEKISKAKAILKNGVIGLIIILASFGIVAFIIRQLVGSTSGGSGGGGSGGGGGIIGIGNGIIKNVYPEPFQKDVPRNTTIIVTFREVMKAATICNRVITVDDLEICDNGAQILPDSIKIFKSSELNGPYVEDVTVTSIDNKTFIFKPAGPRYLGEGNNKTNYTVNLTTDIKKSDGSRAFTSLDGFRWTFEVKDDVLDLVSPKINEAKKGGIFPNPDNAVDTVSATIEATAAKGYITVTGQPRVYRAPSAVMERTAPDGAGLEARLEGTNRCADGTITITLVSVGSEVLVDVRYSGSLGLIDPGPASFISEISLNPCGLRVILDPGFVAGDSWEIRTVAKVLPDTLTIGKKLYTFVASDPNTNQIAVGSNNIATATSINNSINISDPNVTALSAGNIVTVTAKEAGVAGNSLGLSSNNQVALDLTAFSGGADLIRTHTINGIKDQPMNSIIQINFNETINPLTISGSSTDLADKLRIVNAAGGAGDGADCSEDKQCLSYKCSTDGRCVGAQLAGKFMVSNQYKTVEFISDVKCGVNGCGENIYCLPKDSHLKVQVQAASLIACTADTDCTEPGYSSCISNVCQNTNNKNYPVASALNGIVDAANNSLDGNRNDNPQGKVDTWNENLSITDNGGRGDNYEWSFWISDSLDLTTPVIADIDVPNNESGVGVSQKIYILFSKLMSSSSLSTGSVTINNGVQTYNHHLINLWSRSNNSVGYWVTKEDREIPPPDGQPDQTAAILNHGTFSDTTRYRSQVGSGVKDIYQNCYKPSTGPRCTATSSNPSCCRDTGGSLYPTSTLTAQGNCP